MDEIWKDIEGYEGLYQVSNLGRVKALPKYCFNGSVDWLMKEHILKPLKIHSYTYVCLYKNKKYKRKAIHRLVALAFIPNPSNKPDIDHINAIKDDNRAVNLHWVTKTGNMNNPLTRKKISESKKGTPQPKGIDNKRSRTTTKPTDISGSLKKGTNQPPLSFSDSFIFLSSLISFNSLSMRSAFPANMIPSRVDQIPPLTAETAVVTLSFKSSIIYGTSSVSMSMVCDALLNSVGLIEPKAETRKLTLRCKNSPITSA